MLGRSSSIVRPCATLVMSRARFGCTEEPNESISEPDVALLAVARCPGAGRVAEKELISSVAVEMVFGTSVKGLVAGEERGC